MSGGLAAWMSANKEITIAFFTLIGGLFGALLTNWDKIFHKDKVLEAKVSDYTPSSDIETEVRIFLETSGTRKSLQLGMARMFDAFEAQEIAAQPQLEDRIRAAYKIIRKEAFDYEAVVSTMIPVWQKYYNLEAIQELNKFYATKPMREMVAKMPYVLEECFPRVSQISAEASQRAMILAREAFQAGSPVIEHAGSDAPPLLQAPDRQPSR